MVDKKHQGKDYVQDAVRLATREMHDLGIKEIVTSYHPENTRAKHLYSKLALKAMVSGG